MSSIGNCSTARTRPPRLHLPTYPFARERYEAAENLAAEAEARAVARVIAERGREALTREDAALPEEAVEPFELMTFEEVWEEQAPAQTQHPAADPGLFPLGSGPPTRAA